jgi:type IV pilus assembly protein PilB
MSAPRFKDEWLVRLITSLPEVAPERIEEFRTQGRRYLSQALVDAGLLSFEQIGRIVHGAYRIEYANVSAASIDPSTKSLLPEKVCRQHEILPLDATRRSVRLAMANPLDLPAQQEVEWVTGCAVEPIYCLPEHLERVAAETMSPDAVIYNLLEKLDETGEVKLLQVPRAETEARPVEVRSPVVRLVNALLANAVRLGASDIHIEHDEQCTLVRYRVDGLLRNIMKLPRYVGVGPVVSRLKIMADLDISDRLRPQDGRAKVLVSGVEIGLRVSTLPTRIGEKVVMRILDDRSAQVPLEQLMFLPEVARRIESLLEREQGILLVTGPTGSGKTTTLYASLNRLRSDASNIITVEDPIEYRLSGVNQVQVHEQQGLTFASVLRSVLRQDPDVIMVGEIRDRETAEVAFQAALTGHLVLSTLHTNDAVSAVVRLADMGVEHFKIAAGVIGVTAQRLVRRLCTSCAREVPLAKLAPRVRGALTSVSAAPRVREPKGCVTCGFSGYKGRLPVVELLQVTPLVREKIGAGADLDGLRRLAIETGALHSMAEDALGHLAAGTVPLSEILPYLSLEETPLADSRPAAVGPPPAGGDPRVGRVLVAAGDAGDREAMQAALRVRGYSVDVATNGPEAVAALAGDAPDVVVLEAALPVLDARQVIATARMVLGLADLPIVVWAPVAQPGGESALADAGADDVVAGHGSREKIPDRVRAAQFRRTGWSATEDVMRPRTPLNEADRLVELRSLQVLDTPREERFDALTREAQEKFNVPMAFVTLVDGERQWFKSAQGLEATETSRDISFCAHAIHKDEVLVVPDAALDPRFAENPLVTGDPRMRFYAGYPLRSPGGYRLGTLCIVDRQPRDFGPEEEQTLRDLGQLVESELVRR